MQKKMRYSVPDGYFASLEKRLSQIPSKDGERNTSKRSLAPAIKPYIALAAAFSLMVTAGTAILNLSSGDRPDSMGDEGTGLLTEALSETEYDELVEYLTFCGYTVEQFND